MNTKTKTALGFLGMGLISTIGVSCVGVGVWAIANMKHPYINQWIDFKKQQLETIVSKADSNSIKQALKIEGKLTENDIRTFYLDRVSKTKEIFVEDLLNRKWKDYLSKKEQGSWVYDKIRISDVSVKVNQDDKTKGLISFMYDEKYEYDCLVDSNDVKKYLYDWNVAFIDVAFSIQYNQDKGAWNVVFDLEQDGWKAKYNIRQCLGSDQTKKGKFETDKQHIMQDIQDYDFIDFTYDSRYLSYVRAGD